MDWAQQLSIAFHLLNNAAVLAIGTLGYCGLRRRVHDRLGGGARALTYGAVLGVSGILTSLAPAFTTSDVPLSLRMAAIVVGTVYPGIAAGAVATLLQASYAQFVQASDPLLWPPVFGAAFAVSAAYRLVMVSPKRQPSQGSIVILAVATVIALVVAAASLRGVAAVAGMIAEVGPAWFAMMPLTIVALGSLIRHVDRNYALADAAAGNERRFRSFYNRTPVMLTAVGRDGRIVAVSDRWLELLGYRREDVVGKSRYDFLAPGSAARMREEILPALRRGQPCPEVELQLSRRDGTLVDVSASFVQSKDLASGDEEVLSFTVDQTARKEAERALAERESDLRAIIDNAPFAIFLKDRAGRFRLVNRRYTEWFGKSEAEIVGRTAAEIYPKAFAKVVDDTDEKVWRGDVAVLDRAHLSSTTSVDHLQVTVFPIPDERGEIVGCAGFCADISERWRNETALAESRRLLLDSQRLGKLGYILSDYATKRVTWSESLFELRKVAPRDGFTFDETMAFVHPDDRDRYIEVRDRAIAERRTFEIEVRICRGDGSIGWERGIAHTRYDEAGTYTGMLLVVRDITEEKLADEALRYKEAQLRAVMDNAPIAIFLKDTAGRFRLVNRCFSEWLQRDPAQLYGRTAAEAFPLEFSRSSEEEDRILVATGGIYEEEVPIAATPHKPGIDHMLITKFAVKDEAGTIVGIAGFAMDVTARTFMELQLRETQRRLQAILDNAPFAIFLKDNDQRYQLINRTFTDWFGERPEHVIGYRAHDLYPAELVAKWEAIDRELVRSGRVHQEERPVLSARPGIEYVLTTKFPIRDEDGVAIGFAGIIADITARKRAEEALRQSEGRFRALIEHSSEMVVVLAPDGTVTYRSPANADVLGHPDDAIIGHSFFEGVHVDDAAEIAAMLEQLAGNPNLTAAGRARTLHRNGTWRTIAWSARSAVDVPGIAGIIVNGRDVTEAQELEARLREAQKMEAVGRLAGGIAHDFNNILGAILGFAGFLFQDLPRGTPQHRFAERIATAAERGKDLVRQILTFARQGIVERKTADLGALVAEARDLLLTSVSSLAQLEVRVADEGLFANVNAAQVNQILLNLCLNANDALSGAQGNISITLSRLDPSDPALALVRQPFASNAEGSDHSGAASEVARIAFGTITADKAYAHIAVSDTGTGMSHEVLQRVFDPFYTTKGRARGTGLGLSVVHGVVMAHDGAAMVASRLGGGSEFNIYLPLCDVPAEVRVEGARVVSLRGRERVLVVDDEPAMADVLAMGLERLGYEAVAVNDPELALAAFAEHPDAWDVVISDQVMLKMRGLTLLARLKEIRPALRFILWTGFSDEVTAESAAEAGAAAFFIKPVSVEDIATAIRRLFDPPLA